MTARKKAAHPASQAPDLLAAVVPVAQAAPVAVLGREPEVVRKAVVVAEESKVREFKKLYRCAPQTSANDIL
jgi:hypothetical protein